MSEKMDVTYCIYSNERQEFVKDIKKDENGNIVNVRWCSEYPDCFPFYDQDEVENAVDDLREWEAETAEQYDFEIQDEDGNPVEY